jgi:hypothetical protein
MSEFWLELTTKFDSAYRRALQVVERVNGSVTLRWPSGDRLTYTVNDPIWHHFTKAENGHGQ